MKKIEKYLIYKIGTNEIECEDIGGMGYGKCTMLRDINQNLGTATFFDSKEKVEQELERKRKFYNEYKDRCSLYFYDNETKPNDLGILKLTIEEY